MHRVTLIIFIPILVYVTIVSNLPNFCLTSPVYAEDQVPANEPEILLSPEIQLDPDTAVQQEEKRSWLSRNKWWVIAGTAVVGIIAAVALTGGDEDEDNGAKTGTYTNTW